MPIEGIVETVSPAYIHAPHHNNPKNDAQE